MIFLNSAYSAAALVFYLPALWTQTDTEGKQSSEYFEKFGKNTIFNLCKKRLVKNKLSATIHNMKRERIGVGCLPLAGGRGGAGGQGRGRGAAAAWLDRYSNNYRFV